MAKDPAARLLILKVLNECREKGVTTPWIVSQMIANALHEAYTIETK